jgi:hypothetical protein
LRINAIVDDHIAVAVALVFANWFQLASYFGDRVNNIDLNGGGEGHNYTNACNNLHIPPMI